MANAAKKSGPAPMRVVPPGSKPTGRKAVRRKSRKGIKLGRRSVNKTAEIREAALEMVRQRRPPRPVEIVEVLAAKGIAVSSGQVCVALRGTDLALKEHVGVKQRVVVTLPDITTAMSQVGLDDLLKAREFVAMLGTLERAIAALVTLQQLGSQASKEVERAYPDAV